MHAAVIKFNALADAVGTAAQNHDLVAIRWLRFTFAVFCFVGGIQVRRIGRKLRGAGIDPLINWKYLQAVARSPNRGSVDLQ